MKRTRSVSIGILLCLTALLLLTQNRWLLGVVFFVLGIYLISSKRAGRTK